MRNFITYEWFTIFTILGLTVIAVAKFVNTMRFNDFIAVIGNSKYLKIYSKGQKFIDIFDSFLFANLVISLSIFSFFAYSAYNTPLTFELSLFLKIIFTIATVLLIKTLLERLLGSLFEIDAVMDAYLFQKTTFKNYSGIIFLCSNLFLLYTEINTNVIIVTTFVIVCIVHLIGFATSFKNHQNIISINYFYFLLYLCALEIGPYVLLYKVFSEYNT
ncbi:DUF4271 domain-containing protein [Winogradskyella ursingii]|uniref:DUF4271 domain-containing protein n=1 Tax=Winogradskyella ursingii TaxID=2686079 RepID=UPI0015CA9A0E|nr:DUF4271 domain-containing protein [Winogradskyella ursingii]